MHEPYWTDRSAIRTLEKCPEELSLFVENENGKEKFETQETMKALTNTIDGTALPQGHERRTNAISRLRIRHPLLCQSELNSMTRAHLRELRAAEMIAWQLTGGDYLISRGDRHKS